MISGLVHHFKRKKKNGKDNVWGISNIHDIRVGASFQKKEKNEKDNVNDIRVIASFQKKEKKGKDIVGDIEYT